ncbi:MAG: dTMP kinase [Verrucomicrobiales bacterium]
MQPKRVPPVVAILGPDGSGKSTVIDGIRSRLAGRGLEMETIHWRPDVINPRGGDGGPTPDPHSQAPRSYPASVLKLGMLFADWALGYLGPFRRARGEGRLVLCDRHYYDLLVDPRRYRFKGPHWLARLMFFFLPKPTRLLLLDVSPEEIQRRKQEVSQEETTRQVAAYRELVGGLEFGKIIDAGRSPDEVADSAVAEILAAYRPPIA